MGHVDPERLSRLLGQPELAWVLDRARRRIERGQSLGGSVTRQPPPRPSAMPWHGSSAGRRAHALDDGSQLGTLALGAARALAGLQPPGPDESAAEARREAWAAVGVLCDHLSSTVLTLGLPGDRSATGRVLTVALDCREPVWLTLRQLVRTPVHRCVAEVPCVLVVENPSVLALAADMSYPRVPALVCTNGQPRAATMVLLRTLVTAGVQLRHHGDFDWSGITIGNPLQRRLTIQP